MYGKVFYCSCILEFLVLSSSVYTSGHWILEKSGCGFDPLCQFQLCILLFITLIKYYSFSD